MAVASGIWGTPQQQQISWTPVPQQQQAHRFVHQYEPTAQVLQTQFGQLMNPMPSVSHNWTSVQQRVNNRRKEYETLQPRTASEAYSATVPYFTQQKYPQPFQANTGAFKSFYHEAAICSSDYAQFAQRINNFLQNNQIEQAAALAHDCARLREDESRRKYGSVNTGHGYALNLMKNVYTALQQIGQNGNGSTFTFIGDSRFVIEKQGWKIGIDGNGIYGPTRGGKAKKSRKNRKSKKQTRRR